MKFLKLSLLLLWSDLVLCFTPLHYGVNKNIAAAKTITFITHKLPVVDTFGHKNLQFNDKVIPFIIEKHEIPTNIKSEIIVGLIQFSQFGDNFGSWLLQHYLDAIKFLVNYL